MKNDTFNNKKGKLVAGFNWMQSCWENTCLEKRFFADLAKKLVKNNQKCYFKKLNIL